MKKILLILAVLVSLANAEFYNAMKALQKYSNLREAVSLGLIKDAFVVDKFGENPSVIVGESGEVWEFGGEYVYDADSTAPIKYLSSSNVLDVGQTIQIQGLDSLGNLVVQIAITNGRNNVTLSTPLWRVFRMLNVSALGGGVVGILYVHTSATTTLGVPPDANVRIIMNNGNSQTLHTIYTVPKGYVAFLNRGEMGMGLDGNQQTTSEVANIQYRSRPFGGLFQVKKSLILSNNGTSVIQDARIVPNVIPSLSDINIYIVSVSQNCHIWGSFNLILFKEELFPNEFLANIRQPGYY